MKADIGYFYFIKDDFFDIADDPELMQNKENGNRRPCYYCIKSDEYESIMWFIPVSTDGKVEIEVRLEDENVWLTQNSMAELFDTTRNNITMHIKNIFEEGELQENSVSKESLLTAKDGKNYKTKFYNLDLIISVGYCCNCIIAIYRLPKKPKCD